MEIDIKNELANISSQLKEHGEKAMAEAQKGIAMATRQKEQVDELLTQQGEIMSRMQAVEQRIVESNETHENVHPLRAALEDSRERISQFASNRSFGASMNIGLPRAAITGATGSGADLNYPGQQILPGALEPLQRRLTVRDLMAPGRTDKSVIWYNREEGFTNLAAPVSEGALKPKSDLTFETITANVVTLAHLFDVSLQMLDDVPFLESYIGRRGVYGLKLVEENQLLNGSGVGNNLEGLYTAATAYAKPSGATVTAEQDLDRLRMALLQVELAEAFATGIVLHPTSWANIELLKEATTNAYLFTNPQNTTTGRIWGRDVVSTSAMSSGKFLVGDFAMHSQIFDRQDANIAISFENKDNFERNMATIRVEERLVSAIYRPEAFVKGTLKSGSA